jgi:hypothetical protein
VNSSGPGGAKAGAFPCKFCGRGFATKTNMYRHMRQSCKIANSEEGMDKLVEYTLQRQLAAQNAKIDELAALVKNLAVTLLPAAQPEPAPPEVSANRAGVTNTGSISGIVNNVQVAQTINIMPWDGENRITVSTAQIAAAFAENVRLKEYSRLEEHQLTDPEIAPPYVTELLVDLVKRGHADPAARNVYLNPKRADQVLVHMRSGRWEVMPLQEATRLMFDGVAQAMVRVTLSHDERRKLPPEAQNALAMAGLLYDDEPEEYAKRAKAPITAHLVNTAVAPKN